MPDVSFKERLKQAKKAQERSKQLKDNPFTSQDLEPGTYIVRLQQFSPELSKARQEPQIRIDWLVTEGEFEGEVQRQWEGLLNEYAAARVRRFCSMNGQEVEEMIDWSKTEKEGEFVFDSDFVEIVKSIEDEAALYRIEVTHTQGTNRTFVNVAVLQIIEDGEESSTEDSPVRRTPPRRQRAEPRIDYQREAVKFCLKQGIKVKNDTEVEEIAEKLVKGFVFWPVGTSEEGLRAAGYYSDPEDGAIDEDEVALLDAIGAEDCIVCR
jgi:hypothetical protein